MLTNFILLSDTLNFFTILWFIFWVILFLASFKRWEGYNWIFGFLIIYIIFFPIYKRWDRYLNDIILKWPEFWFSIFIIISLLIFWIILCIQVLPEILLFLLKKNIIKKEFLYNKIIKNLMDPHINKDSKIKIWLENFSLIWYSWYDLFFEIPGTEHSIYFLAKKFPKYLNSNVKILWFFGFTLFLPRILTLFALFYDIYVEKQLCWFPIVSLLLTISIITRMCLIITKKGSLTMYTFIRTHLAFEDKEIEEFPEEFQKKIKENFSEHVHIGRWKLKEEFIGQIDQNGFNRLMSDHTLFVDSLQWCDFTNSVLDSVSTKILLLFVTGQLLAQINIILKNYEQY